MILKAVKFTPEVLLSAPRRSPGAPNSTGEKVLHTVITYSFEEHRKTSQIRVLDLKSGKSDLLFEDAAYSEPTWIGEDDFLFIKSGDKGTSSLMVADASKPGTDPHELRAFPGSISNLKARPLADNAVAIACTALATPAGDMYNAEADKKPHATGKVYTSLFVRHWDAYVTENTQAIWYGSVRPHPAAPEEEEETEDGRRRRYVLAGAGGDDGAGLGLTNALAGTGLQSPVPPFGGAGDFDIGARGLAFVARDPAMSAATHTKSDLYLVPLASFTETPAPAPRRVRTPGLRGYAAAPAFEGGASGGGRRLAFTRMRALSYESDKPRLLVLDDVAGAMAGHEAALVARELYPSADGEGAWDARPEAILWAGDGRELYVTAEARGRGLLWRVPLGGDDGPRPLPEPLVSESTVVEASRLADASGKLFLSCSSLVDSSYYAVLDPAPTSPSLVVVSSPSRQGKALGLSKEHQFSEIWYPGGGGGDYRAHALVLKPPAFDAARSYPLAFLIHGGPQGAWTDSWSTRWNPALFAAQGYVVVLPNPTGSTGYGMALQNGIRDQWGGRPYADLVSCFDYIAAEMPYVDTARAVALGASYGGYMINWIQGQPLGRRFKALVCHDGVFSTLNQYSSEELFFPIHEFGGTLWGNREGYEKWDPAKYLDRWATPELIIHSELDYRLPITEGLAAFNALQTRGVPSRLLIFPDENHWVLKPENSLLWHKEVLLWINKYAGVDSSDLERDMGEASLAS